MPSFGVLAETDGGEHDGLAVGRDHRAVGLARDLAGFKLERPPTPIDFDGMRIEHR